MQFRTEEPQAGAAAAPSGQQWHITAAGHRAVIVEVGGGLREYSWHGRPVVAGYAVDEMAPHKAGNLLAPWPNRIRDGAYHFGGQEHQLPLSDPTRRNAIHGLVSHASWRAVGRTASSVTLTYRLPARPGYPWSLAMRTVWSVGPRGLRVSHEVTNVSAVVAPFGFGVHPYIVLPGDLDHWELHVPAASRLLTDARKLPVGAVNVTGSPYDYRTARPVGVTMLNTSFGEMVRDVDGVSAITVRSGAASVRVWADVQFAWWQVYSSDGLPSARRRRALAIEPMTCPPDAFRSGRDLITLASGQTWRASWGITPGGGP